MILNIENHPLLMKAAALYARIAAWFAALKIAIQGDKKGWSICGCVLLITIVRSGITYSFGMFVVKLESTYGASLAEQNWIGTLSFCISLSMAPISVMFIRALRYRGYRLGGIIGTVILSVSCLCSSFVTSLEWMFFTHSILYGVGSSLIYMASSLVIGEYFDNNHKYHVLATSILLCGYPVGSLLFNPINAALVTRFGWRVAFRVSSFLIIVTGLGCCWNFSAKETPNMEKLNEEGEVIPPSPEKPYHWEDDPKVPRRCCTMEELKKRPEIILWYIANCLSYLGFFMPFLNLAYYMNLKGITTLQSSWSLTLLSFAECITYIVASLLGDYLKGKLIYVNVVAAAALAVICIMWPFVDVSYSIICVIAMVMGGFLGLTIVYTYAASGEVTQLPIDIAWSFTNLWSGVGILMGPFFSGAIYDLRKSYDDVFYVVGSLYVIDAFIFGAIAAMGRWRRSKGEGVYDNMDGQTMKTMKVPQRSVSKNSLMGEAEGGGGVAEYGSTQSTTLNNGGLPLGDSNYGSSQNGYGPPAAGVYPTPNPHNPFAKPQQPHPPPMADDYQGGGSGGGGGGGGTWVQDPSAEEWKPKHFQSGGAEYVGLSQRVPNTTQHLQQGGHPSGGYGGQ